MVERKVGELEGFALVSTQGKFIASVRVVAVEITTKRKGDGTFSLKIAMHDVNHIRACRSSHMDISCSASFPSRL